MKKIVVYSGCFIKYKLQNIREQILLRFDTHCKTSQFRLETSKGLIKNI